MVKCWTTKRRTSSSSVATRKRFLLILNARIFDSSVERGNAEPLRRPRWSEHPSATRPQRVLDDRLLVSGERAGQRKWALDRRSGGQPALVDREFVGVAHDHRPLNHVLQLAHIARPRIRPQVIERPLVDAPDRLARLPRVAIDEVLDQQRDVVGPLAKRRHRDGKHVQPVEEIAAERARLDRRLQVAVRGGDHAHVDANRCASSDTLELTLLQDAEQRDLGLHRQLADFVEEDGPAVRQLEAAEATLRRTGERPFLVAEELRRDQLTRNGRAVHADERGGATRRPPVDRAGDEFLARAGLARDQHGGVGLGDFAQAGQHRLQRR